MWHRTGLVFVLVLATFGPLGPAWAASAPAAPEAPADPAGGTVGTGSPDSCDEAALHAALVGGGTVTFNCGAPTQIPIVHEQVITQATTIAGGGMITITGGLTTRLFNVAASASLDLRQIALDSGFTNGASGGAIANAGTLRLNEVVIQFSKADLFHSGGAIFTSGPLFVYNSTFYHNVASGGGAIYAVGSNAVVEIHDTNFMNNDGQATSGGGGAIWVRPGAIVYISGGRFSENSSEANGGAVYNEGTFAADQTLFDANTTTRNPGASFRGYGGAIANTGDLTLSNTYLVYNGSRYGGGLYVGQGAAPPVTRLQTAYVIQNQAVYSGGGVYASTVTTATAVLTVTDSVIVENWADVGGGLSLNNSAVNVFRSAIGKNHANSAGGIASSAGPGPGGLVRIYDSTIYSNVITTTQGAPFSTNP